MKLDVVSRRLFDNAGSNGPIILMYHSIGNRGNWPWAVTLCEFCRQLDLLKEHGWTTINLAGLVNGRVDKDKTVVISFDDGYDDNYAAYEALRERDMTATWFLVSGDLGGFQSWSDPRSPRLKLLSEQQVKEMANNGMEIGSHTRTHPRLVQLGEYHVKKGSLDEDEGILDDAAAVYPIEFTKTIENEALNYFLDEDYVDAIVLYKQLPDAPETRKEFIHYTLARCYMDDILLDTTTAMIHLEIALDLGFNYTWVMDYDPIFSDQHDHPRWLELRARLPKSNIDEKLMEVEANVYLRPISH